MREEQWGGDTSRVILPSPNAKHLSQMIKQGLPKGSR
jgi:hypothetical protein